MQGSVMNFILYHLCFHTCDLVRCLLRSIFHQKDTWLCRICWPLMTKKNIKHAKQHWAESVFQLIVVEPKSRQLLRPITVDTNSAMSQSQIEAITCGPCEARENARVQVAIDFGITFDWLKKVMRICWPITERSDTQPKPTRLPFDIQMKTALKWFQLDFFI